MKQGLFKSKELNLRQIENELVKSFEQMDDFGKNLKPGENDNLFVGVAIVVV